MPLVVNPEISAAKNRIDSMIFSRTIRERRDASRALGRDGTIADRVAPGADMGMGRSRDYDKKPLVRAPRRPDKGPANQSLPSRASSSSTLMPTSFLPPKPVPSFFDAKFLDAWLW